MRLGRLGVVFGVLATGFSSAIASADTLPLPNIQTPLTSLALAGSSSTGYTLAGAGSFGAYNGPGVDPNVTSYSFSVTFDKNGLVTGGGISAADAADPIISSDSTFVPGSFSFAESGTFEYFYFDFVEGTGTSDFAAGTQLHGFAEVPQSLYGTALPSGEFTPGATGAFTTFSYTGMNASFKSDVSAVPLPKTAGAGAVLLSLGGLTLVLRRRQSATRS
jgi:hypothetical protein